MSLVMPVKDGVIQDVWTKKKEEEKISKSGSNLDKDAFLQLLVAQMKYQDPLEPTSNTEYISQLATFSSLEEMQNMRASMDLQRASGLVGKEVYIKTTDATTGATDFVHGMVDFVQYENGKAYLSVGGNLYSIEDLDSVYDQEYTEAYSLAYDFTVALNKLPPLNKLTLANGEEIDRMQKIYDGMTKYQLNFLTKENREKFESYVDRIALLRESFKDAQDAADKTENTADGKDKTDDASTETDKTDKTDKADKAQDAAGKTEEAEEETDISGIITDVEKEKKEETSKAAEGEDGDETAE